jgi:maltose alpha-D-glucosyltransferase/alpha-amylase
LSQVLWNEGDYFIIDFEGDPAQSIGTRRARHSALRDVAGMVRSISYAANVQLAAVREREPDKGRRLTPWAEFWERAATEIFVQAYRSHAKDASYAPPARDQFAALLNVFLLDEAVTELQYELEHRPGLVFVPLAGIARVLNVRTDAAADDDSAG